MRITFSPSEIWSFDRESIIVYANADGKPIKCIVPQEFLTAPFAKQLSEAEACKLFSDRRLEIEGRLKNMIEAGVIDQSGEVILRQ
jgi:hypothetical protein